MAFLPGLCQQEGLSQRPTVLAEPASTRHSLFLFVSTERVNGHALHEPRSLSVSSPPVTPVVSDALGLLFSQFGYEGRVPLKSARLFYDISEKARKIVESYFMLNSTLYFSYTHMVCRTALSGRLPEPELVPSFPEGHRQENSARPSSVRS